MSEDLHLDALLGRGGAQKRHFGQRELAGQGDALGTQAGRRPHTGQIVGVHLGGQVQRSLGQRAGDLGGQADILHDEAVGAGAVGLAHAFQRRIYLARQDHRVHGHIDGNAAQMREIAGLPQGLDSEIVGPAACVERLEPQVHRIGPRRHRRMERHHIPGRRQQFHVLHVISPHHASSPNPRHRFAQGTQRGPDRHLHLC